MKKINKLKAQIKALNTRIKAGNVKNVYAKKVNNNYINDIFLKFILQYVIRL